MEVNLTSPKIISNFRVVAILCMSQGDGLKRTSAAQWAFTVAGVDLHTCVKRPRLLYRECRKAGQIPSQ